MKMCLSKRTDEDFVRCIVDVLDKSDDVMNQLIIALLMHWTHGDDALLTTELLIPNAGE